MITRRRRLQMKEEMRIKILHRHTDRMKISCVHINKKERRNRFPIQEAKIFLPKPVRWNDEVDPCSKWRARFFRWNELGFYFSISHFMSRCMIIRSRKSFMCQFERVSPWYELILDIINGFRNLFYRILVDISNLLKNRLHCGN